LEKKMRERKIRDSMGGEFPKPSTSPAFIAFEYKPQQQRRGALFPARIRYKGGWAGKTRPYAVVALFTQRPSKPEQ
jgi:hypothetical protein